MLAVQKVLRNQVFILFLTLLRVLNPLSFYLTALIHLSCRLFDKLLLNNNHNFYNIQNHQENGNDEHKEKRETLLSDAVHFEGAK